MDSKPQLLPQRRMFFLFSFPFVCRFFVFFCFIFFRLFFRRFFRFRLISKNHFCPLGSSRPLLIRKKEFLYFFVRIRSPFSFLSRQFHRFLIKPENELHCHGKVLYFKDETVADRNQQKKKQDKEDPKTYF